MLGLDTHAEFSGERGDAVLGGADPVCAQVGTVPVDGVGAHLPADPLARLQHHHGPSPGAQPACCAQPAQPAAYDRDVDSLLCFAVRHPAKLTQVDLGD